MYMVFGRTVIFDMMLTLCMSVSVIAAYEAMEGDAGRGRLAGMIAFAAAGLGTITKGPVALLVPLLVVVTWALLRGRPGLLVRLRPLTGLAVFGVVVLPWVWLASVRNPGYLEYALVGENLQRMTSNKFDTARPLAFYARFVIPAFFPWMLYACGVALRRSWHYLRHRKAPGEPGRSVLAALRAETDTRRLAAVFAGVWAAAVFMFFSLITSKRPSYILPCSVPIALATGMLWARALAPRPGAAGGAGRVDGGGGADGACEVDEAGEVDATSRAAARADLRTGATIAAVAALALAALFALPLVPGAPVMRLTAGRYGTLLARHALFGLTAGLLALAGILMLATRRLRRPWLAFGAGILAITAMVPMARSVARYVDAERSSRAVSRYLETRLADQDRVICFEEYRPGLNFYLRRPIHHVTRWGRIFTSNYIEQNLDRFRGDPGFRRMPEDEMRRILRDGGRQVYILAPRKQYDLLAEMAAVPLRQVYEDPYGGLFVPEPAAGD